MTSKNFNDIFTYEYIEFGNGKNKNIAYMKCVMLKDADDMKKGDKLNSIEVCYTLYGCNTVESDGHDIEGTYIDYSKGE